MHMRMFCRQVGGYASNLIGPKSVLVCSQILSALSIGSLGFMSSFTSVVRYATLHVMPGLIALPSAFSCRYDFDRTCLLAAGGSFHLFGLGKWNWGWHYSAVAGSFIAEQWLGRARYESHHLSFYHRSDLCSNWLRGYSSSVGAY